MQRCCEVLILWQQLLTQVSPRWLQTKLKVSMSKFQVKIARLKSEC